MSWSHRSQRGFDATRYSVRRLDERTAKAYVVQHHYSGTFPAAIHRIGLWLDRIRERDNAPNALLS